MSHTKGPWYFEERQTHNDEKCFWILFDDFYSIAEVRHGAADDEYGGEKALIANAHLIAAAPELLEDLETLVNVIERGTETPEDLEGILEYSKKLIKRAKGEL